MYHNNASYNLQYKKLGTIHVCKLSMTKDCIGYLQIDSVQYKDKLFNGQPNELFSFLFLICAEFDACNTCNKIETGACLF